MELWVVKRSWKKLSICDTCLAASADGCWLPGRAELRPLCSWISSPADLERVCEIYSVTSVSRQHASLKWEWTQIGLCSFSEAQLPYIWLLTLPHPSPPHTALPWCSSDDARLVSIPKSGTVHLNRCPSASHFTCLPQKSSGKSGSARTARERHEFGAHGQNIENNLLIREDRSTWYKWAQIIFCDYLFSPFGSHRSYFFHSLNTVLSLHKYTPKTNCSHYSLTDKKVLFKIKSQAPT